MPKAGWHSGHKESRSPRSMGGGLRAPLPYLGVSHQSLTGEPGSGGLPLCISLQPSPHQDNSEPAPTWYLWFLGSLAQAPGAPTDTSWDLQRDRVSWQPAGTGTWGCGPPLGGGSQSVQGNFIQLEIHPHRVPLPWSYPWLERSSKPQVSPPMPAVSRHCVQLIPVVLADFIVAGELLGAGPGLGVLVPWRQQEGCAPCQQHVPDAVGVVIVFAGHHGSIDGEGQGSQGEAGQEVEDPALPGGGVAVSPAPAAVHLGETTRASQGAAQGCECGLLGGGQGVPSHTGSLRVPLAALGGCGEYRPRDKNMDGTRGHTLSSRGEHVWGAHALIPQLPGEGVWAGTLPTPAPYPHGNHDHDGKEARPHCVPGGPAVQLQGHGEDQSAQHKEDLGETKRRWRGHGSPRPGCLRWHKVQQEQAVWACWSSPCPPSPPSPLPGPLQKLAPCVLLCPAPALLRSTGPSGPSTGVL